MDSKSSGAVLTCLQAAFEELRALSDTGGSRPVILRLPFDKGLRAASFLLQPFKFTFIKRVSDKPSIQDMIHKDGETAHSD